jgi:hypothetical protein
MLPNSLIIGEVDDFLNVVPKPPDINAFLGDTILLAVIGDSVVEAGV